MTEKSPYTQIEQQQQAGHVASILVPRTGDKISVGTYMGPLEDDPEYDALVGVGITENGQILSKKVKAELLTDKYQATLAERLGQSAITQLSLSQEIPEKLLAKERIESQIEEIVHLLGKDMYHIDPALRASRASEELRRLSMEYEVLTPNESATLLEYSQRLFSMFMERRTTQWGNLEAMATELADMLADLRAKGKS